jgi:hypothetical protein
MLCKYISVKIIFKLKEKRSEQCRTILAPLLSNIVIVAFSKKQKNHLGEDIVHWTRENFTKSDSLFLYLSPQAGLQKTSIDYCCF